MRERLYQWHLRLVAAFSELTPEQEIRFEAWQEEFPHAGAYEWPGWSAIIGERPRPRPALVMSREKSA